MNANNSGLLLNDLFEVSLPAFAIEEEDLSLVICCKKDSFHFQYALITNNSSRSSWLYPDLDHSSIYIFPLYLSLLATDEENGDKHESRASNLNPESLTSISKKLALKFTPSNKSQKKENASPVCYANSEEVREDFKPDLPPQSFSPIDLLNYIYAVLYSPTQSEIFKTSWTGDFPLIPYPKNQINFWKLTKLGDELRKLHLLESELLKNQQVSFPVQGNNEIKEIRFEENYEVINGNTIIHLTPLYPIGRIYINKTQFFQGVAEFAWEMIFGNHKPAQTWLNARKGTILSKEDIHQFQMMLTALTETERIRTEIDKIPF